MSADPRRELDGLPVEPRWRSCRTCDVTWWGLPDCWACGESTLPTPTQDPPTETPPH